MAEWQDIATAPKDGTKVLFYCERWLSSIMTGGWREITYKNDAGEVYYDGSGWQGDGFEMPENMEPFTPTHWQPLPEPPK